jgi:acyl-CoA thioesterase FadM
MTAHRASLRVRYKEIDQMGVVYYSNYFVWKVHREKDLLAEGETVHVFTNSSGKQKRIPPILKEVIE